MARPLSRQITAGTGWAWEDSILVPHSLSTPIRKVRLVTCIGGRSNRGSQTSALANEAYKIPQ